jgi:hypothetical protein
MRIEELVLEGLFFMHTSSYSKLILYKRVQILSRPNSNNWMGHIVQRHHRPQWFWQVQYPRRNMFCPWHHKYATGASQPRFFHNSMPTFRLFLDACTEPAGPHLQARPGRHYESKRNYCLRQFRSRQEPSWLGELQADHRHSSSASPLP